MSSRFDRFSTVYESLRSRPPKWLAIADPIYKTSSVSDDGDYRVTWGIHVPGCSESSLVLGPHATAVFDNTIKPSFCPRAIEACGRRLYLFDASRHGYHNELTAFERPIVGNQEADTSEELVRYSCPNCGCEEVIVEVELYYGFSAVDVFFNKPHLPLPDMFDLVRYQGECTSCGKHAEIGMYDGL